MDSYRITYLLQRYLDDRLTPEEQVELDHILQQDGRAEQMRQVLGTLISQEQDLQEYQEADWDPLFQKIQMQTKAIRPVRYLVRARLIAAAALVGGSLVEIDLIATK